MTRLFYIAVGVLLWAGLTWSLFADGLVLYGLIALLPAAYPVVRALRRRSAAESVEEAVRPAPSTDHTESEAAPPGPPELALPPLAAPEAGAADDGVSAMERCSFFVTLDGTDFEGLDDVAVAHAVCMHVEAVLAGGRKRYEEVPELAREVFATYTFERAMASGQGFAELPAVYSSCLEPWAADLERGYERWGGEELGGGYVAGVEGMEEILPKLHRQLETEQMEPTDALLLHMLWSWVQLRQARALMLEHLDEPVAARAAEIRARRSELTGLARGSLTIDALAVDAQLRSLLPHQLEGLEDEALLYAVQTATDHRVEWNAPFAELYARALPELASHLYAARTLELQVDNGGFGQALVNLGGGLLELALGAYESLGAADYAEIAAAALHVFRGDEQRFRAWREAGDADALHQACAHAVNAHSAQLQSLLRERPLTGAWAAAVRARPGAFVGRR